MLYIVCDYKCKHVVLYDTDGASTCGSMMKVVLLVLHGTLDLT